MRTSLWEAVDLVSILFAVAERRHHALAGRMLSSSIGTLSGRGRSPRRRVTSSLSAPHAGEGGRAGQQRASGHKGRHPEGNNLEKSWVSLPSRDLFDKLRTPPQF